MAGHQVIITFDIDENKVQANAEKEAGRQVAEKIMTGMFGGGYEYRNKIRYYVKELIEEMLKEDKEDIINMAIKSVTDSLNRTKMVRDKLKEIAGDDDNEGTN